MKELTPMNTCKCGYHNDNLAQICANPKCKRKLYRLGRKYKHFLSGQVAGGILLLKARTQQDKDALQKAQEKRESKAFNKSLNKQLNFRLRLKNFDESYGHKTS